MVWIGLYSIIEKVHVGDDQCEGKRGNELYGIMLYEMNLKGTAMVKTYSVSLSF